MTKITGQSSFFHLLISWKHFLVFCTTSFQFTRNHHTERRYIICCRVAKTNR